MKFDVAIVGAGIGGLVAASELRDLNIIVIEKLFRPGGTSYSFRRKEFEFLTGPLGFSHPNFVNSYFKHIIGGELDFIRTEYQLLAGDLDIVISKPLNKLQKDISKYFPGQNVEKAINKLKDIVYRVRGVYTRGGKFCNALRNEEISGRDIKGLEEYFKPSYDYFSSFIEDEDLLRLISGIGIKRSDLSTISTAYMWDAVSETGIWYPSDGLKSMIDKIYDRVRENVKLRTKIDRIYHQDGYYVLKSESGELWAKNVISDMDMKNMYYILDEKMRQPMDYVRKMGEGSSVLTVYVGVDMEKIEKSRIKAHHVLYYPYLDEKNGLSSNEFYEKELEVTFLSDYAVKESSGQGSLMIRTSFGYDKCKFRTKEEYYDFKEKISRELVEVVEPLIPNLKQSIKVIDASTPLTYEKWGGRFRGSVIGWNWEGNLSECLVETPLDNFYSCGIYSFTIPFLGAFPTSVYSGKLAADLVRFS